MPATTPVEERNGYLAARARIENQIVHLGEARGIDVSVQVLDSSSHGTRFN